MFIPRQLDKFTNYNSYVVYEKYANRVDHQRLFSLIKKLREFFKHPYIRFMWMGDDDKAMCVIYSDFKSNKRMTKLIPFEEAESEVSKLQDMKKKLPEHPFNEDYPFMVVPLNENEEKKAKAAGIPSTFCNSELGAREVMNRQNKHSGILWKVRPTTENDKLNWKL